MKIKVLGSAASEGVPAVFCSCANCAAARVAGGHDLRSRSQFTVNDDLMVDFGDDTFCHSLREGVNLSKIKYLLITHSHVDHYNPSIFRYRGHYWAPEMYEKKLYVCSPPDVRQKYEHADIRAEVRENIQFIETDEFTPISAAPYTIHPLKSSHLRKNEINTDFRCYLYMLESDGKRILFGNDSGYYPDETFEYLKGMRLDLAFLDCTHGLTSRGLDNVHMGFPENLLIKEKFLENGTADKNTVFVCTHFSHNRYVPHTQMSRTVGEHGFTVAYDGAVFEV